MTYSYDVMLVWDPAYFEKITEARDELNGYGSRGWDIASIVPLAEDRGYAIVFRLETE